MEAKEIGAIVDSMHEDELDVLSQMLTLSDPERFDAMILRENGRPLCDACGCAMSRNGTDGNGIKNCCYRHLFFCKFGHSPYLTFCKFRPFRHLTFCK